MAIQFARIEIIGRSSSGNACRRGAYNARCIIKDEKTNIIYNFKNHGDNVYHKILLPNYADKKFEYVSEFMNLVESSEKRKDSQLLKDIVLALPDDKELTLEDKIIITHRLIEKREWIKEGLGVQIDIHEPHDGEKNWHAHLLVTTRRFTKDGKRLGAKAVDLNPEFKKAGNKAYVVAEDQQIHEDLKDIINDYFKELGLENRVDAIAINRQEHIGPVRMRKVLNGAIIRNEERVIAEIEHLNSGERVLAKVTKGMSVFSRGDLIRAVKCVFDLDAREKLIEDALSHKSVVALYREDGVKTEYFTTDRVRAEEEKILRLSNYVANLSSVFKSKNKDSHNIQISLKEADLSNEQYIALSQLINSNSGLSILRGRAGVGKSHVLKEIAKIARSSNIYAIGLAPTHKAKEVLALDGFECTDTVKGMLFKLANGRFSLPKKSLLVVDEAGMIGNSDYQELLRVAATRKCTVILSGDERQLASIGRGGMFEVFARRYGSSMISNIKRQSSNWGRAVATAFSQGEIRSGVSILEGEGRIKRHGDARESMEALLADWHKSSERINDRLILAVKNKDVSALNHGVRQYLKLEGKLTGSEIEVGGNHYMRGDRILISRTSKELGVVNGDLGEILEASTERFVVALGSISKGSDDSLSGKVIEFNPRNFSSFKHGYATTVFKAQGASIKDVYVFHDGFAGIKNSYVALSRNINELKLYTNNEATSGIESLIRQLSYDPDSGSSLNHYTLKELETMKMNKLLSEKNVAVRAIVSVVDFVFDTAIMVVDKYLPKSEYYNYREPQLKTESVFEVIDRTYEQNIVAANDEIGEKLAVGDNVSLTSKGIVRTNGITEGSISNKFATDIKSSGATVKVTGSAKDRFYARADYLRARAEVSENLRIKWDNENEHLRREAGICAERITKNLLGEPNKRLSNGRELRYGDSGKLVVRISGEKSGTWYDFSKGKGGDMFDLVQDINSCDFKSGAEYLREVLGLSHSNRLELAETIEVSNKVEKYIKDRLAHEREVRQKQFAVDKLVQRSKDITKDSIAFKYLTQRGINCNLASDIKMVGIYVNEKSRYLPALIGYARDEEGRITGGVQVILNNNGLKADIDVPKRSFGRIGGSFIDLGKVYYSNNSKSDSLIAKNGITEDSCDIEAQDKITILAEGVETGLSVKQALSSNCSYSSLEIKILCSLGINNIANYKPIVGERIIIAADNDGVSSITSETIEKTRIGLESKGAYVEVVRPEIQGDFNDMLRSFGECDIQNVFDPMIEKHTTTSLSRYVELCARSGKVIELTATDKENLAFVQKYNLPEKDIVEVYRQGEDNGRIYLEDTRKSLEFAHFCYRENKELLFEAKRFGYKLNELDITKAMMSSSKKESNSFCKNIRDNHLNQYLDSHLDDFSRQKNLSSDLQKLKPIIVAEQQFLKETYKSLKFEIGEYSTNYNLFTKLQACKVSSKQSESVNKVFNLADKLLNEQIMSESDICRDVSSSINMISINKKLGIEGAAIKLNRSKTIDEALESIEKKESFLASIDKNEYGNRLSQIFELKGLVQKALSCGIYSKYDMLDELKNSESIEKTFKKFEAAIEAHHVISSLLKLENQKQEAKSLDKVFTVIKEEQAFLAGLHDKLKYPEMHDTNLINSIKSANDNLHTGKFDKLAKFVTFLENNTKDHTSVISTLRATTDITELHQSLLKNYHEKCINVINTTISTLDAGKSITLDGKKFDCSIRFLNYLSKTRTHEYFPHQEFQKIQSKVIENQKELELSKSKGLELEL